MSCSQVQDLAISHPVVILDKIHLLLKYYWDPKSLQGNLIKFWRLTSNEPPPTHGLASSWDRTRNLLTLQRFLHLHFTTSEVNCPNLKSSLAIPLSEVYFGFIVFLHKYITCKCNFMFHFQVLTTMWQIVAPRLLWNRTRIMT